MRVLVACEFSGVVRDAFRKRGHDSWSCDILDSNSKYHIKDDVVKHLDEGWDLLIAHPPCTYISNAGARHLYPNKILNEDRYVLGLEARKLFMVLYNANINKICVENPTPSKIFELPKHSQVIQPYQFGHPYSKRTLLWLRNLPELKPTNVVDVVESTKVAGNWFNKGGKDRQKNRSVTFAGIAEAMAEQWGC
jgi:hypothetical protein